MDDIFVAQVMSTDLQTVAPGTPLPEAARRMLDREIGSVLVVEDDRLAGIVTTTDFVRVVADGPRAGAAVDAAMTTDVVTADPQDTVREAADAMLGAGVHHLPVVDGDAGVVGVIATTDLAAYLSHVEAPSPA